VLREAHRVVVVAANSVDHCVSGEAIVLTAGATASSNELWPNPGASRSVQYYGQRSERWILVLGAAKINSGKK